MTNYYEELNLDKMANLNVINQEISRLESTWKRREITNPEKAARIIALLVEARKVFRDATSRSEYDKDLERSLNGSKVNDSETEKYRDFKKWSKQAESFFDNGEFELAKTSIDKALTYADSDNEDADFFGRVANIYMESGYHIEALDYINKAMVVNPDESSFYALRGRVYIELVNDNNKIDVKLKYKELALKSFRTAISKAKASGDREALANALGLLAGLLYYNAPFDKVHAIELARESQELGGDRWGNSKAILDTVKAEEDKKRNEKLESRYQSLLKYQILVEGSNPSDPLLFDKLANEFDGINEYKDSGAIASRLRNQASEIREKERELKVRQEIANKDAIFLLCILGGLLVLMIIVMYLSGMIWN